MAQFIFTHSFENRTATTIPLRQLIDMPIQVFNYLVLGRRNKSETDPIPKRPGKRPQRARCRKENWIEYARACIQFLKSLATPY